MSKFPLKPLGELVAFLDSRRRPVKAADRSPGPYPYYGANGQQGTIDGYIFDEPLVLLAEDGGHFFEPNRGIAYKITGKTWVNNHAHVLRPKKNVDINYLCLVLRHMDVTPHLTGTTRAKLTKAGASRIEIPLPPLAEQMRIAAILDAADALRAKRRESLVQLDTLIQSTFLDMFGDPVTNPKGWDMMPIKKTGSSVQIGPFGSLLHKDDYVSGGIPLINPKHIVAGGIVVGDKETITQEKANELSNYILMADDVIMARRGEMGRCAVVSSAFAGMLCGTGSLLIRPNLGVITPLYLSKVISSQSMQAHLEQIAWGVTMANLNRTKVESLIIPIPSIDYQHRFAKILQSAERQKARLRAHLTELDTLFASLQQRAFNGEL
jgi:type I restriction enzyme S subunit